MVDSTSTVEGRIYTDGTKGPDRFSEKASFSNRDYNPVLFFTYVLKMSGRTHSKVVTV